MSNPEGQIDHQAIEEVVKTGYREAAARYRHDDEIEVTTENHRHLGQVLRQLCRSFGRPISVLEAGCGTGRYFHCLENVERLVGIDLSAEMLAAARDPVRRDQITVKDIQLIQGNIHLASFTPQSFDFIYSLGVLGHHCLITVELLDHLHTWLKPGGKLFFNSFDLAGLPLRPRLRRRLREILYPALPRRWQALLDERERRSPFFGLTRKELESILSATRFTNFTVDVCECRSPLSTGRHLECLATRT